MVGCSSVVVTDYGEETAGLSVLQEYLKNVRSFPSPACSLPYPLCAWLLVPCHMHGVDPLPSKSNCAPLWAAWLERRLQMGAAAMDVLCCVCNRHTASWQAVKDIFLAVAALSGGSWRQLVLCSPKACSMCINPVDIFTDLYSANGMHLPVIRHAVAHSILGSRCRIASLKPCQSIEQQHRILASIMHPRSAGSWPRRP